MEEIEAFRIKLAVLQGDSPIDVVIKRMSGLKSGVRKILAPLSFGERLRFERHIELLPNPTEWLVVKISPSGQLPLFGVENLVYQIVRDVEASRESETALELARVAVSRLRALAVLARLTPREFHQVLSEPTAEDAQALALRCAAAQQAQVLVRDPHGRDATAPAIRLPQKTTLGDETAIDFKPYLVGKGHAIVRLKLPKGSYSRKRVPLHWGDGNGSATLAQAMFTAGVEDRPVRGVARETVNKNGALLRLEWMRYG